MFNEQKITCDMKGKDKNSDKFKTGARLEDIISLDLRKCRHQDCQVSLGEYLRQNSEEYWNKYRRLSREEHRRDYTRRNSEGSFQDYLRQSSEDYRSECRGQCSKDYRCEYKGQSNEDYRCEYKEKSSEDYRCENKGQSNEDYRCEYKEKCSEDYRCEYKGQSSEDYRSECKRRSSEDYHCEYKGYDAEEYRTCYLTQSDEESQESEFENIVDKKRKKSSAFISAMTKIARRKGKSSRRRSSVFIQFYSKLRKREESSGSVVQHAGNGNAQQNNCTANHQLGCVQHGAVLQQTELTVITATPQQPAEPPPFLWVYSSSNHSLDTQVHHSQDLLVRPDSCEVIDGECKNGIRKNLRGKWNRLVKKKPHHDIYTIPAELKPQLKQIYVY